MALIVTGWFKEVGEEGKINTFFNITKLRNRQTGQTVLNTNTPDTEVKTGRNLNTQ